MRKEEKPMADHEATNIPQSGVATTRISHISILQASKVFAVLYAIMGLCFAPFLLMAMFASSDLVGASLLLLILIPIIYGVIAFIFTAIGAWVYNQIAKRIGGVEIRLAD
jgi:hypothetical protein